MHDGRKDYYKINRRLRMRKWSKHLQFLWTLLIIPLGFVLYFVMSSSAHDARQTTQVTMASPVGILPPRRALPRATPARRLVAARRAARVRKAGKHARAPKKTAQAKAPEHWRAGGIGNGPSLVKE